MGPSTQCNVGKKKKKIEENESDLSNELFTLWLIAVCEGGIALSTNVKGFIFLYQAKTSYHLGFLE